MAVSPCPAPGSVGDRLSWGPLRHHPLTPPRLWPIISEMNTPRGETMRRVALALILVLAVGLMFAATAIAQPATTPVKADLGLTTGDTGDTVVARRRCRPVRICRTRTFCSRPKRCYRRCQFERRCRNIRRCRDCSMGRKCRNVIRCRYRKINNRQRYRCKKERKCRPKRYCGGRWKRCKVIKTCSRVKRCRRVCGQKQKQCRTVTRCRRALRCRKVP